MSPSTKFIPGEMTDKRQAEDNKHRKVGTTILTRQGEAGRAQIVGYTPTCSPLPFLMEEDVPTEGSRSYWKPPVCVVFIISHVVSEKSKAFPVTGFLC